MTEPERQSRRDFLRGRIAGQPLPRDHTEPSQPDGESDNDCVQFFSHRAMACEFEIYFNDQQYPQAGDGALESFECVDQIEQRLTVYNESSEVVRFNQLAPNEFMPLSNDTFEVLRMGREMERLTGGAFDMSAARLSTLWTTARADGSIPTDSDIAAERSYLGSQYWQLDDESQSVRKLKAGVELNLGGIGKGFALDQCHSILDNFNIRDYLFHGGLSSVLAQGRRSNLAINEQGWWVGIGHPIQPGRLLAQVRLGDQALSTSGTRRQGFVHGGKWYGHVIDPRTGYPACQVFSATAIAPTAAEADALSTAFYVMGRDAVEAFCQRHPQYAALVVSPAGESGFRFDSFNIDPASLKTGAALENTA